jgi:anti-sigma B factor antagonist
MGSVKDVRDVDDIVIVDVQGRLTIGEGYGSLRQAIVDAIRKGHQHLLVNLGAVSYSDSYGLEELVTTYTTAINRGATLKFVNVPDRVKHLLRITKLDTVFELFDDEPTAMTSFVSNSPPRPT